MAESARVGDQFSELLHKGSQAVQQNRPDVAIPLLEKAVQMNPESFDALFWLGAAYSLAQRWEEAAECFEQAKEIRPGVASVWYNLGVVYWRMGRNSDAIDCFEATLQIDPNHAGAKKALSTLIATKPGLDTELTPL
ncbi:MAG: tetratricopeptide repeat protein [Armatimonadetes bacterium]|nr:tetratricopeptide repeat protein [Armatimonadota bacterium]